jgi:hypothetical protein
MSSLAIAVLLLSDSFQFSVLTEFSGVPAIAPDDENGVAAFSRWVEEIRAPDQALRFCLVEGADILSSALRTQLLFREGSFANIGPYELRGTPYQPRFRKVENFADAMVVCMGELKSIE